MTLSRMASGKQRKIPPSSIFPPLAVTMGEPAGIGGELVLQSWLAGRKAERQDLPQPVFFLLDDPQRIRALASHLHLDVPITTIQTPQDAPSVFARSLPILPIALPGPLTPGCPAREQASAIIQSIKQATDYALSGQASGLVTNPIHKANLYAAGFCHDGHTEFLAYYCRKQGYIPPHKEKETPSAVMMLTSSRLDPPLRVALVTLHLSLKQAITELSIARIVNTATTVFEALRHDFSLPHPRLAITALNPHAGEEGAMGDEETIIIQPAIDLLKKQGYQLPPPLPADTVFCPRQRILYDAVICMYHDQALIPLKTLDFDGGVNVTLGLPVIRTSPDHGPALDIAHTGKADPGSFMAALALAHKLAWNRLNPEHRPEITP